MKIFHTSRDIAASLEQIYAAISTPERLAKWWGPEGFTNSFAICEFKTGGRWSFTMHGPDGTNYPNENLFALIEPMQKIIIQHVSEPKFSLTIALSPSKLGTLISWSQEFESEDVARAIAHIIVPSNEQNLDRLTVEALR